MTKHSFRLALNGIFAVYKPRGMMSGAAMKKIQLSLTRELFMRSIGDLAAEPSIRFSVKNHDRLKIGHGGTLDPMAEGVLVLGVGTGCKELSQFLHCTKEYVVTAKFGHATNTYDAEGHITHSGPIDHLTEEAVYKALSQFRGRITQLPPIYSALRIEGKRLYEYAREGKALPKPIQPRPVTIHQLDLVKYNADHCILRVECSSGTYMRSLVHDLGQALGTYAHMTALLRTRQGSMTLQDALTIEPYVDYEAVFKRLSSYQ